ncbi:MAG TPA: phytanoyl-CoA dioxygenase family protein [Chloroflexota bacterium]|nr:phytanoyl-CoA dioxygenase family protein [Chloroflexota bacterium]
MVQSDVAQTTVGQLELSSNGYPFEVGPDKFGELRDSNDLIGKPDALRTRMREDGYLLLRGYLGRDRVLAARQELFAKLDSVGLVDRRHPLIEGIWSGDNSQLGKIDRRTYARELRAGAALRDVVHRGPVMAFYEGFLGGPVRSLDYIWVRNVRVGSATPVHFDWVYMGRGTRNLFTTWIPMGDVPLTDGPLALLEGSHRIDEIQRTYGSYDVDRDGLWNKEAPQYKSGWLGKNVTKIQSDLGGRWLTTEFRAGDLLAFGMFQLHCSLDNKSPLNRIRLSTDTRYQLASEPADERWIGDDPFGHGMD